MHFKPLDDLSRCRILLSNDDGIDARGIKLLEQELLKLSNDVWVVAPKHEKSVPATPSRQISCAACRGTVR